MTPLPAAYSSNVQGWSVCKAASARPITLICGMQSGKARPRLHVKTPCMWGSGAQPVLWAKHDKQGSSLWPALALSSFWHSMLCQPG